jgi:hypothetical protein
LAYGAIRHTALRVLRHSLLTSPRETLFKAGIARQ